MEPKSFSFCMSVCSRRRPELLQKALESVAALTIPEGIRFSVLLVENDDTPQYAEIARRFQARLPLVYEVEPKPGLTRVRNRALASAEALGVDWLGSIDDDVTIPEDWLVHMVGAIRKYPDTQIFYGNWQRKKNPEEPAWHPTPRHLNPHPTGRRIKISSFNDIAVSADVFSSRGMGIRFDHTFNFIGGEDSDFTYSYLEKGGIIRSVHEAHATEIIPDSRASLPERLARVADSEYIMCKIRHKHSHPLSAHLWNIQTIYRGTVLGAGNISLGLLARPFNRIWGLRRYAIGRQFLAGAQGVLQYYAGAEPEPYRDEPPA